MKSARLSLTGIVLLTPFVIVSTGFAQDSGGRRMVIDLSQRLEGSTNVDLDPDDRDEGLISTTNLAFGISTATPLTSLGLRLGARYREDFADDDSGDFEGPNIDLDYARRGATSSLSFGASYNSQDVEYLDRLDLVDFLDDDGDIPIDLDDIEDLQDGLNRTGTRNSLSFNSTLVLGAEGPYGLTFRVSGQDVSYSGLSGGSTLEDSESLNTSVTGRVDINPVLAANATLRYRWQEEGNDTEETGGLSFGLSYKQPTATYGASINVDSVDGDTRYGLSGSIAKSFARNADLNLSVGLVQTTSDDLSWNGSLRYSQPLSRLSAVNVSFRRAFTDDPDEGETAISALSAGYNRSLTRLTSLGLNAQFTRSEDLDLDESDTSARVSASVSYSLTRDWALTGGVSHTLTDEDGEGSASSTSTFVQIGRSFQTQF